MIGNSVLNAHAALVPLVKRLASGDLTEEEARKRVLLWARTEARGRSKLSAAAISVLEYDLAEEGLEGTGRPEGEVAEEVKALRRLKAALMPPEDGGTPGRPVEVKVPEQLLARSPKMRGFRLRGGAEILASPEAHGWLLTVSHPRRFPTHRELQAATTAVGEGLVFWAHVSGAPDKPGVGGFVVRLFEGKAQGR